MKGYKAYNKGLVCRGFQYEEGQTYETDKAEMCKTGFHFCENPLDVLGYYDLCGNEFTEVEAIGDTKTGGNKSCTTKITIGVKLDLSAFIKASVDFLLKKTRTTAINAASGDYSQLAVSGNFSKLAASGDYSQLAASGDYSQLAASGNFSKLAVSGNFSQLAASGDYSQLAASGNSSQLAASGDYSKLAALGNSSQLAASGDYSQLAASGNYSKLEISGKNSVGAAIGINSTIKAAIGCWITIAEYENTDGGWLPVCVKSAKVDGKKIKADTWYKLEGKKFVEVEI